ncbi:MAG: hypothetical protein AAFU85_06390 [Planctomycetota bacterium]
MKTLRRFFPVFILVAGFLITAGGCGSSDNTVVEPGELTAEQEEEMAGLKDELEQAGRATR